MSDNDTKKQLEWLKTNTNFKSMILAETPKQRLNRKVKENPLVPIGCLATFTALTRGLWHFRKGNERKAQIMMRARILAQGFTILSLLVGIQMLKET